MGTGTERYALTPMGKEITKAMIDRGITQRALAAQLGISVPALSRAMHGRRSGAAYWPQVMAALGLPAAPDKGGRRNA